MTVLRKISLKRIVKVLRKNRKKQLTNASPRCIMLYVSDRNRRHNNLCASGSVGGARPCQGRGRGFESRLALFSFKEIQFYISYARVAQLVEHDLAKVGAAGSSPVSRSFYFKRTSIGCPFLCPAGLVLFEVSAPLCTVSRSYFDVFSLLLAFFENRNLRFSKTKHFNRHLLNFMYCFRSPKKPFTRQIIHIVYTQISPLFLILLYIF